MASLLRNIARNLAVRATAAIQQFANPAQNLTWGQYAQIQARAGAEGKKRPPTDEIQDLPVNTVPAWDLSTIRSAVNAFSVGTFGQSALLVEGMLADDRIQSATNGRIKGVTKCSAVFEPPDDSGALGQEVADDITKLWSEFLPEETIEQLLTWTIFLGFALCEVIWESRDERWIPRLKVWHPLYIYYQIDIRRYVVITMSGPVVVDPNDPKWFLFTPYGSYRGWLRGAVRSCSIPWLVRQFALRDWARYSEVHGLPQKKVKYPAQAPADAKASFFASIKRLGAETSFALPQQAGQDAASWDVELLEARDRSWEAFPGLIGQCDSSITLAIRGTNLTTEVTGGSFAAAETHRDEDSDFAQADRNKLSTAVRQQILSWYCVYNYGDSALAPHLKLVPPESSAQEPAAKLLTAVAQAVTALETAKWPIDREAIADRFDIPLLEGADLELKPEPEKAPETIETEAA